MLRTLVEAEIAARDDSNLRNRLRVAQFPVVKSFDDFKLVQSSVPQATFDYICSLEWVAATENLCLIGPAGTGKSHVLVSAGHAAVTAGMRVRYLSAAELIESLYRGLADNSVGKIIDSLLRYDLIIVDELGFALLDDHGTQLLFRFVAAAYERRSLGIASHWPFEQWGRFLPEHTHHRHVDARPAAAPRSGCHHGGRILPDEGGSIERRQDEEDDQEVLGVGHFSWPPVGTLGWSLTSQTGASHQAHADVGSARPRGHIR